MAAAPAAARCGAATDTARCRRRSGAHRAGVRCGGTHRAHRDARLVGLRRRRRRRAPRADLCRSRRQAVPGVGDAGAEWMFVGEAPGAEEDAKGRAIRRAGRTAARQHARRAGHATRGATSTSPTCSNAARPATARPSPREVDACRPYLDRQIELIRPKLIVALGKSAATTLLAVDATIASLRGRVHRYQGVPLIVTYHPAYLLRNLPDKAKAWEDLCLARATIRALHDAGGLQSAAAVPK